MLSSFYSDQSSQRCLLQICVPPNFQFFIFIKKTCLNIIWLPTNTLILFAVLSLLCDYRWSKTAALFISGSFPQTSDWNAAWNHRLPLCTLDGLHHADWRSQSHHSFPLSSQTLRGRSRLGIVPAAPLASDSVHQYWGSFLGCAANTLIITLNRCAVMGYQSCQLWWNEMEDRKRVHHGYGHTGRNCATHNNILYPNRVHLLAFMNVSLYTLEFAQILKINCIMSREDWRLCSQVKVMKKIQLFGYCGKSSL